MWKAVSVPNTTIFLFVYVLLHSCAVLSEPENCFGDDVNIWHAYTSIRVSDNIKEKSWILTSQYQIDISIEKMQNIDKYRFEKMVWAYP